MTWIKRRINKEKSKHEGKLDWSESAEKKIISNIMEWCYKNNTIPFQEKYDLNKLKKQFGREGEEIYNNFKKMSLCVTDGGWVNLIKLQKFLEGDTQD